MRLPASTSAVALLAVLLTFSSAPIAAAQEEGVTLDPGSPAAKEYALPHESARKESGEARNTPVKPGERDSALFGEGVKPDAPTSAQKLAAEKAAAKKRAAKKAAAKKRAAARKRAAALAAAKTTPEVAPSTPSDDSQIISAATSNDDDSSGGGGSTGLIVGGVAALLLLAVLGGFGLRAVRSTN